METSTGTETRAPQKICTADLKDVIDEYAKEDAKREELIKRSRDLVRLSKHAIFCLHRNDKNSAETKLGECKNIINKDIWSITNEYPSLRQTGMLVSALEEYAEAEIFNNFIKNRNLLFFKNLSGIRIEEYLGGLIDCTGELNRFAVLKATKGDSVSVEEAAAFIGSVHEELILLNIRNSNLRRKYDTLKYTQKKIEALLYELAIAKRMQQLKLQSMLMEPEPEIHNENNEEQ